MKEIQEKLIEDEMKEAYVDYAMSVITSRALPDVNDGLKPVHRRILYAMNKLSLQHNKPHRKSAYVVGRVLAEFHPHGDSAVYDALARMAQDFSLRYPLVDGQGNWGCFTGDTKIKLLDGESKSFEELCKEYKNKKFYVYSVDKEGKIVIGEARNPRITKKNVEIIELTLDSGEKIRCTPDHKFLLKSLKYKEAKDLTEKDSLMAGYFKKSKKNNSLKEYLMIKSKDKYEFVHDIVDNFNLETERYKEENGSVRHHKNFDKLDNNPENIERLSWEEHTKIHNEHIKELWKDEGFRKKQREGVQNYLINNPEAIENNRKRLVERNKNEEFIKENSKRLKEIYKDKKIRNELSKKIRAFYEKHPEARKKQSKRSKEMWKNPKKREEILNKLIIAMKDIKVRKNVSEGLKKIYKQKPEILEKKAKKLKEFYKNNPEARKLVSERSQNLWKNPEHRNKFVNENYNHFSEIGKLPWLNESFRERQSLKAKKQWENEDFRKKVSKLTSKRGLERVKQDPTLMKKLSLKAGESHRKNWKDEGYKKNVIKNKILNYVNYLINKIGEKNITKETYEDNRYNNCFPKFDNAMTYFSDVDEMVELAKEYNHKIIEIRILNEKQDVYDITVKKYHNFLLDCGVFVHNSIDGDKQAASRYTEARLTKLSSELLSDIEKNTVKMNPNYDESSEEPRILPTKVPNLLVNGSSGIAVGMATNMPPHNMNEVLDALVFHIDNPECSIEDLMKIVKGPDFPTGGFIMGRSGIKDAYLTGKGKVRVRAKTALEEGRIIVTEIPYMVNKSLLIENIANLVRDKRVEGIRDLRDESDRKGMRIVIELKRNEDAEVIRNNLFKFSQLQVTFGVNNLALVAGEPKLLNLKDILYFFVEHRKRIVTRRTEFDLGNAEKRAHILLGLKSALENIDLVVKLIKGSESPLIAKNLLIKNLRISKIQSEAILDMRLHRLTSLEQGKIKKEYDGLLVLIKELREILGSENRILDIIKKECLEMKEKYGDERRTEILEGEEDLETEDLIEKEDVVVTFSNAGYVKRMKLDEYKEQRRGGRGVKATGTKEEDFVEDIFVSNTHDYILFFSDKGKVYWLKTYRIPEGSRYGRGKAIVNLLRLEDEKINAVVVVKNFEGYLVMVTKKGIVKRVKLSDFSNVRKGGIKAIKLNGDELVDVKLSNGSEEMIICSSNGNAVRFKEEDVRVMGRNSYGVRGMKLVDDKIIGMEIARDSLLTVTENGYGKRSKIEDYRVIRRGGKGVRNIKTSERNGKVVGVKTVTENDEVMFVSEKGILIRVPVKGISEIGRNTQGVRIMKLGEGDKVVGIAKVLKSEDVEVN